MTELITLVDAYRVVMVTEYTTSSLVIWLKLIKNITSCALAETLILVFSPVLNRIPLHSRGFEHTTKCDQSSAQ